MSKKAPGPKGSGRPQQSYAEWVAADLRKRGAFFEDTGEIEHGMYLLESYAQLAERKRLTDLELERARDVSGLRYLEERLRAALDASGIEDSRPDFDRPEWYEIAFSTLQAAYANALRMIRGASRPEDWDAGLRAQLYTHLLEIHAMEGDVARSELAEIKNSRKKGGEGKTAKSTKALRAMHRALEKKLDRRVTAKVLVAEAIKRGWMVERGGDLELRGGTESYGIIPHDLQLISNRLRKA